MKIQLKNIFLIISFWGVIFSLSPGWAQTQSLRFERFGPEQNFPSVDVLSILQDKQGLMWFGTKTGLIKYDGYKTTVYRNEPGKNSISDNRVRAMLEDSRGIFWIGTSSGGLNILNREKQIFTKVKLSQDANTVSATSILSIFEDSQNNIWIGTYGSGVYVITSDQIFKESPTILNFRHHPDTPNSLSNDIVMSIFEDNDNQIWLATWEGLNRMDSDILYPSFTHFKHDPHNPHSLSENQTFGIYQDSKNRFWVSTFSGGINRLVKNKNGDIQFLRYKHDPKNPYSLSNNATNAMLEDKNGDFWVATFGGGLCKLIDDNIHASKQFINFEHNPSNTSSLSENNLFCLNQDQQGNLWIGTYGQGLNKLDPQTISFGFCSHLEKDTNTPSTDKINALYLDAKNNLWVGNGVGHLDVFVNDPNSPHYKRTLHFNHKPNNPNSLNNSQIFEIVQDSKGRIWLANYGEGLTRITVKSGKYKFDHFRHNPQNPSSLSSDRIMDILYDRDNNLWIATQGGGLSRLAESQQGKNNNLKFINYRNDIDNPASLCRDFIMCLAQDSSGTLWIGSDGGGLDELRKIPVNEEQAHFVHHTQNNEDNTTISHNIVYTIYQDSKMNLWVGTNGGGLNKYNFKTKTFEHFREKDGLSSDAIQSLVEDDYGTLWIGTKNGLTALNVETGVMSVYDMNDGLQSNNFEIGVATKDKEGKLYFGGEKGLNIFDPQAIEQNNFVPPVILSDFFLLNKSVSQNNSKILDKHIQFCQDITLNYTDNIFAFEFSSLNYRQSTKNQFAYKLENFNDDWVYTTANERKATFTNIPHGSYIFHVKASNDDGLWNETGTFINLTILPPWWETILAKSLGIFLVLGIVGSGYLYRINLLKKRQRELEAQVAERTQKVVQQKLELETQHKKLLELDHFKEGMTGMIVHDLKNPLNVIMNVVNEKLDQRKIPLAQNAARQMLNMVMDILDVQKFEDSKMSLDTQPHSAKFLAQKAVEQVNFISQYSNILIEIRISDELTAHVDAEIVERVLVNILTNALKYTPNNGKILIEGDNYSKDLLCIKISDTGEGIPAEKIDSIFDKFGQVKAKKSGSARSTGLGLTFCKLAVESHGGEIWVKSELGRGTIFSFTLPKSTTVVRHNFNKKDLSIQKEMGILVLDKQAKQMLAPFKKLLSDFFVYESTEIKKILSQINSQENKTVEQWIAKVNNAVYSMNETQYIELLKSLD